MENYKTMVRKSIHVFNSIVCVILIANNMTVALCIFCISCLVISIIPAFVYGISNKDITGPSGRDSDTIPGIGGITYMLGILFTILLSGMFHVPDYLLISAIIALGIGDTVASITGQMLGTVTKIKILDKSWLAMLIAISTSVLVTQLFTGHNINILIVISSISVGLFLELLLGHKKIRDQMHAGCWDNLLIPIVTITTGAALIAL